MTHSETMPLKTVAIALAIGMIVFLGGNILMFVLLYPETVLPAPAPAPAAEVASVPAEQSAAAVPTSAPVQPTAVPAQAAAAAPAAGANLLGETTRWRPVSGSWVVEGGSARQTQAEGFDHLLVYDAAFEQPQLDVRFAHETGVGAGVMFNLPQMDRVNDGHLVRYLDAGTLIWGSFNGEGAFVAQGTAAVADPAGGEHRLEVSANDSAYRITLDGTSIAEGIPLVSTQGYVALTGSQTAVRFTSAAIQGAATATTFTGVSGDWVAENGVITQRTQEMRDFLTTSGIQAERYIVSIDITLPDPAAVPDSGGGLVFHMGGREDLAGGHMVRFHRGGQELLWGWYDSAGVFQYEAGQPLTLSDSRTHTLTVNVRADQYDVAVDGAQVLSGIPLRATGGWIGLLSFGGNVSFANFRLAITGET